MQSLVSLADLQKEVYTKVGYSFISLSLDIGDCGKHVTWLPRQGSQGGLQLLSPMVCCVGVVSFSIPKTCMKVGIHVNRPHVSAKCLSTSGFIMGGKGWN